MSSQTDYFANLPPELIEKIFYQCIPASDEVYVKPDAHNAPLVLLRVCSLWRNAALSYPLLWMSVDLGYNGKKKADWDDKLMVRGRITAQAKLWNQGSRPFYRRALSIGLTLYESENPGDWNDFIYEALLKIKDVVQLRLDLSFEWDGRSDLVVLQKGNTTLLEDLHVKTGSKSKPFKVDLGDAERLRRVIVECPYWDASFYKLPWVQLTTLIIQPTEIQYRQFLEIVKRCTSLTYLSVSGLHCRDGPYIEHKSISLPHLEIFYIEFGSTAHAEAFYPFTFPSLKHLRLQSSFLEQVRPFSFLESQELYKRHLYSQLTDLQTLELGYQDISAGMLIELLRHTRHLEELTVDSVLGAYNYFFQELDCSESKELKDICIPRLKKLTVYVDVYEEEWRDTDIHGELERMQDTFDAMLVSRSKDDLERVALDEVTLCFAGEEDTDIKAWTDRVESLKLEGLKFRLLTMGDNETWLPAQQYAF